MSLILIGCGGHRGDAIRKMQVREYLEAPEVNGNKVVFVQNHKTRKSSGAAVIPLIEGKLRELMDLYLNKIRYKFDRRQVKQGQDCPAEYGEEPFFINTVGGGYNDVRGVVKFIRDTLTESCSVTNLPSDFTSSAVRTWVAHISENYPNAAKLMNHTQATHDRHYLLQNAEAMVGFSSFVLATLTGKGAVSNAAKLIDLRAEDGDDDGPRPEESVAGAELIPNVGPVAVERQASTCSNCSSVSNPSYRVSQVFSQEERHTVIHSLSNGVSMPERVTNQLIQDALSLDGGENEFALVWKRLLTIKTAEQAKQSVVSTMRAYYGRNRGGCKDKSRD